MESDARPPEKLSDKGPMSRNWKRWKQDFLIYMKLTGGVNKPEDEKAAWLKNLIGQVGLEALESISFGSPDDKENMTIIIQKLEELFDPPKNEIEERYNFFSRSKKGGESIDAYIEDLKIISKLCNFGDQTETLVRDAVILDIKDKHLRKIIFEEKDLDLEKLKIIYKTYESNNAKLKDAPKELIPEQAKSLQKRFGQRKPEAKNPCWRCGEKHALRECPAHRNLCCYCKNFNHFSHRCPVAKLDSVEISNPGTTVVPKEPNNSRSPFAIEKDLKPDKGYKNNLNSLKNDDKQKIIPEHKTLKPPVSLMDLKIQKTTPELSPRKEVFQTNKNAILNSSKKGERASQSNFQVPRPQNCQPPREYTPLYPTLPYSTLPVPHSSQNNLQSNARKGIPEDKTLKSDLLVKNLEVVDSGKPKKVENQFSTCGNLEKVAPQQLWPITTRIKPSAPHEFLLDSNIPDPTTHLSTRRPAVQAMQTKNKITEFPSFPNSAPSVPHSSQNNSQYNATRSPAVQTFQTKNEIVHFPSYPTFPNSAPSVPHSSQNSSQSNATRSPAVQTLQTKNKIVEVPSNPFFPYSASSVPHTSQNNAQSNAMRSPVVQTSQTKNEVVHFPSYPTFPSSAPSVPHSSQNNSQANATRSIPLYNQSSYVSYSTNLTIRKEPAKPKQKSEPECVIS